MAEIFQKYKKIFLFGGIFLALLLLYWLFFGGSGTQKPSAPSPTAGGLVSEAAVTVEDEAGGRELLAILTELQSITLDSSIFSSPAFISLNDWSKPIDPQPLGSSVGRRNPFSDFGGSAPAVSTGAGASNLPSSSLGTPGN